METVNSPRSCLISRKNSWYWNIQASVCLSWSGRQGYMIVLLVIFTKYAIIIQNKFLSHFMSVILCLFSAIGFYVILEGFSLSPHQEDDGQFQEVFSVQKISWHWNGQASVYLSGRQSSRAFDSYLSVPFVYGVRYMSLEGLGARYCIILAHVA